MQVYSAVKFNFVFISNLGIKNSETGLLSYYECFDKIILVRNCDYIA
jgi:hypothetical protein